MTEAHDETLERLQEVLAGTWSIEREIGRGGMGVVYLARDVSLDRPVAIKVLHPHLAGDPNERERFLREARTGARLSHPHIVPIYAVEEQHGFVYFVMALVDGESAGDRVRREGPLVPDEAERIVRDIAWGLAYAHAMNLVHRDVTLDNILIERSTGRAVLADFGIAAEIDRSDVGPLIGTPMYLAPEIIQGSPPSPQSDLYALGVVAWTLLSGRPPFIADDTPSLLLMHVTEPAPLVSKAAPRTPPRMSRVIQQALEKDPSDRATSMEAWIDQLQGTSNATTLADPLRQWLGRWDFTKPFYALGMSVFAMLTADTAVWLLNSMTYYGPYSRGEWGSPVTVLLATGVKVLGGVFLVHAGLELAALRRIVRAGYRQSDIVLVLARAREQLRRTPAPPSSLLARVVHDLGWLAGGLYVLLATSVLRYVWLLLDADYPWNASFMLFTQIHTIGQWAYVVFWSAIGFSFLLPSFRFTAESVVLQLRDRFWNSRMAGGLLRLASIRLAAGGDEANTLHRPTELVLDLAIEDLWKALPATTREGFGDVPDIVAGLRRRVSDVRETEHLIDNSSLARSDTIREFRQRLADRHEAGVTALERIRLALARLGTATAPAGEFTAKLDDARALERALLAELGAHRGLLKQLKRHASTPTPTPTPASA